MSDDAEREERMRSLAAQLYFEVRTDGDRFSLHREMDVAEPIHTDPLTPEAAEHFLSTWTLRGAHGG